MNGNGSVLTSASCSGTTCIAVGSYSVSSSSLGPSNQIQYPLVAVSTDGGVHWSYTVTSSTPTLPSDLAPNGNGGALVHAYCNGTVCFASGYSYTT